MELYITDSIKSPFEPCDVPERLKVLDLRCAGGVEPLVERDEALERVLEPATLSIDASIS